MEKYPTLRWGKKNGNRQVELTSRDVRMVGFGTYELIEDEAEYWNAMADPSRRYLLRTVDMDRKGNLRAKGMAPLRYCAGRNRDGGARIDSRQQ